MELKSRGVGIIFITHFLEQVYEVCDRITVLRNGELVGAYDIKDLPRVQLISKMMGKELDDITDLKTAAFRMRARAQRPCMKRRGFPARRVRARLISRSIRRK